MDDYPCIEREGIGIRLAQNHGDDGAPPGNRRVAYYIDVRDVDALYAALKPKLVTADEVARLTPARTMSPK